MDCRTLLSRRHALALGASVLPVCGSHAQPTGGRPPVLMVAGPVGGRLDRWADLVAGPIGRGLPGRAPLVREHVGGLDGVTGANQFAVRGEPDGGTALLVPGSAALAWLLGEARAKFDPARWVPLWAAVGPGVLVSRVVPVPGRPLRVASAGVTGPELPVFLALDLMGVDGVPSPSATADAMLVLGPGLVESLSAAAAVGMRPVMTLSGFGAEGEAARDPLLPTVPTAVELVGGRAPAGILAALRSTTLAVQLDAGLVLPQLTPAGAVATWRAACAPLAADAQLLTEAARIGVRLVSAAMAASCTSGIAGEPAVLLSLRRWLATRYDWRPS